MVVNVSLNTTFLRTKTYLTSILKAKDPNLIKNDEIKNLIFTLNYNEQIRFIQTEVLR